MKVFISIALMTLSLSALNLLFAERPPHITPDNIMSIDFTKLALTKREIDNRFMNKNFTLAKNISTNPKPGIWFYGTSRSKFILDSDQKNENMFLSASNSYAEMYLAPLAEIEGLTGILGNPKVLIFEGSILLRLEETPFSEPDHEKYLGLLESNQQMKSNVIKTKSLMHSFRALLPPYSNLKLSSLYRGFKPIGFANSSEFTNLDSHGKFRAKSLSRAQERNDTSISKPKVDRLIAISKRKSSLLNFRMIVEWAKQHDTRLIFFIPPVRSDYFEIELKYGLLNHIQELEALAKQHDIEVWNFISSPLKFPDDFFGDEDHLATCEGMKAMNDILSFHLNNKLNESELNRFFQNAHTYCAGN